MIDYEKFYNYLKDVVRYYQEKKTLKGFSELAKKHHCAAITRELFFKFGLDNVNNLERKTSNDIRNIIAKGECVIKPAKEEQENNDDGICTFKDVGDWIDFLGKEQYVLSGDKPELLPKLRHGMLVYIVTNDGKWVLDWFSHAGYDAVNHKLFFTCVCDSYCCNQIYPCTPHTRCMAETKKDDNSKTAQFWKEIPLAFQKWCDNTIKEVSEYCKTHDEYRG